ncbi:MAG: flagellar basal body-associated FliL family protein [Treponema sp.]|jgi:flagellar basal body-associated protein FliL|nr:flagellar basal body-associated FliL family protein [Treponema sp.]
MRRPICSALALWALAALFSTAGSCATTDQVGRSERMPGQQKSCTKPKYSTKNLGSPPVRTWTKDEIPYSVVVDMRIAYDLNDSMSNTELTSRTEELRDFVRGYFRSKTAAELRVKNQDRLKQDIIELLNTRYLNVAKVRAIYFDQLDVKMLKYKVGDTGPAGGTIFYMDRAGFISNGVIWHYLEAAPADLPGTYQWGGYDASCSTGMAIGTGAENTAVLASHDHGTTDYGSGLHLAAKACTNYTFGGYSDWFLPSWDELNLMYTNLKKKGLGGFSDSDYWSSSEDGNGAAWGQYFDDSAPNFDNDNHHTVEFKNDSLLVRAARMF